jgi:hypothetical protein
MTTWGICPEKNSSKRLPSIKEKKLRCRFFKLNEARLLSHLEMITVFSRALRRAGIPIKYSEGFHPLPRIISGAALPVGVESICEYVDFIVWGDIIPAHFLKKMNRELPPGIKLLQSEEVPLKFPLESDMANIVNYLISLDSSDSSSANFMEKLRGDAGETKKGEGALAVLKIDILNSTFINVSLHEKMGPAKMFREFFHMSPDEMRGMRVLKTVPIKSD